MAPVGVIEVPRVQLDNGLFRTIEKSTSVPTDQRQYRRCRRWASFIQGGSAKGRWRTKHKLAVLSNGGPDMLDPVKEFHTTPVQCGDLCG